MFQSKLPAVQKLTNTAEIEAYLARQTRSTTLGRVRFTQSLVVLLQALDIRAQWKTPQVFGICTAAQRKCVVGRTMGL